MNLARGPWSAILRLRDWRFKRETQASAIAIRSDVVSFAKSPPAPKMAEINAVVVTPQRLRIVSASALVATSRSRYDGSPGAWSVRFDTAILSSRPVPPRAGKASPC